MGSAELAEALRAQVRKLTDRLSAVMPGVAARRQLNEIEEREEIEQHAPPPQSTPGPLPMHDQTHPHPTDQEHRHTPS